MFGNRFVHRSWGWYFVLLDRKYFKVKLLKFFKGGKLSTQYHTKRNEIWLFLKGDNVGNFFTIPICTWHDFYAFKKTYVLEIQYGQACEESDIIRK